MSRKEAERRFKYQDVLSDLKQLDVTLGTPNKNKITDECLWAYISTRSLIMSGIW